MAKVLSSYEKQLANQEMPAGKKKVLIAALHLFANQGFHATTTAQIAKEAKVSEGTIYKYFSSKRDLLSHLLSPLLINIRDSFIAKLDKSQSLEDLIKWVIQDRTKFAIDNFELIKILIQEVLTTPDQLGSLAKIMNSNNGITVQLQEIKKAYPQINQHLTTGQILRTFAGPILAYILQISLFHLRPQNSELEINRVTQQIIAGLKYQ